MGLASLLLGLLALACAFIGAVSGIAPTVGPWVSVVFSFASPLTALVGIVLGGVGTSRAREDGGSGGLALAGLIISVIAFFPGLLVALSCGLCNSYRASEELHPSIDAGMLGDPVMPYPTLEAPDAGYLFPLPEDPPPSP
jgi:hypothetical protein